jgi:hypothetical protein
LLIIDSVNTTKNRNQFSARAAGITGISMFGRDIKYALDGEMEINFEAIDEFLKKIQQVKKVEPTPEEDSPEPTPEQPKQEKPAEKKYLNEARQLLACTKYFEVKAKQNSAVDEEGKVISNLLNVFC